MESANVLGVGPSGWGAAALLLWGLLLWGAARWVASADGCLGLPGECRSFLGLSGFQDFGLAHMLRLRALNHVKGLESRVSAFEEPRGAAP